jgi:hypothetical protein
MEINSLFKGGSFKKSEAFSKKNKTDSNYKISLDYYLIVMMLGTAVSILWVIFVNSMPFSDFDYYYNMAVSIANGGSWGNTYTSMGYSIVLGGIFKIFGASVLTAKIFNIVLTIVNYIFFRSILFRLDLEEIDRKIIFTIFVFMPNNIFYNSILGTELLFTALLLIITDIYMGNMRFKYILIGVLVGLNTMVKPFFIAFFLLVFLVDVLKHKKLLLSIENSIIVLILSAIVISPWIYRNSKLMGQFTYVSNNGGIVLYINNNSQNHKGRWMPAANVENSVVNTQEYKNANMTEKNKMLSSSAKKWIKSHPADFIKLGSMRLFNTYFVGDDIVYSTYASGITDEFRKFLIVYANLTREIIFLPAIIYILIYSVYILIQLVKGRSDSIDKFNIYSVILFFMFTGVYFITEGQGRYSFPIIFLFVYCFYMSIGRIIFRTIKKNN